MMETVLLSVNDFSSCETTVKKLTVYNLTLWLCSSLSRPWLTLI